MSMSVGGSPELPKKFDSVGDLRALVSDPGLKGMIEAKEQAYYSINIGEAMTNLVQVGSLLQVAYAASKGYPCSESVIKILGNYQTLVHDSNVVSGAFVEACVAAVEAHVTARDVAQEGEFSTAVELLADCKSKAGKMAAISGDLVEKSSLLVTLSQDTLEAATHEEAVSEEKRRKILETIGEQKAVAAKMKQSSQDMDGLVREAKARERELAGKLDQERGKQFALQLIEAIMVPAGQIATSLAGPALGVPITASPQPQGGENTPPSAASQSTIEALAESERQAAAKRAELQDEQRKVNAALTESVERLKGLAADENRIELAVQSLETVVITMGKVKTVFERVRQFWLGVQKHCESLEEGGHVNKLAKIADKSDVLKGKFIASISASGFNWAALGMISLVAKEAIVRATDSVDRIMTDLPDAARARGMLTAVSKEILAELATENNAMEALKA